MSTIIGEVLTDEQLIENAIPFTTWVVETLLNTPPFRVSPFQRSYLRELLTRGYVDQPLQFLSPYRGHDKDALLLALWEAIRLLIDQGFRLSFVVVVTGDFEDHLVMIDKRALPPVQAGS